MQQRRAEHQSEHRRIWVGSGRIDDVLYKREEAAPETSVVYGLVEE
jgi:hypothetical protein